MMWIVRAGQEALFYEKFITDCRAYLPWNGYQLDLSRFNSRDEFRSVVINEKMSKNRTSISNWSGQLFSFVKEIGIGDYILIPAKRSHSYTLAVITGPYKYYENATDELYHSRSIKIICTGIPRSIFSQTIIYSLGAFRTLFKVKYEKEVMHSITSWKKTLIS